MGRTATVVGDFQVRLVQAMRRMGYSVQKLAEETGFSEPTCYQVINGKQAPTNPFLVCCCNSLNVEMDWLARGSGPMLRTERSGLTESEISLLGDWAEIPEEAQRHLRATINMMARSKGRGTGEIEVAEAFPDDITPTPPKGSGGG